MDNDTPITPDDFLDKISILQNELQKEQRRRTNSPNQYEQVPSPAYFTKTDKRIHTLQNPGQSTIEYMQAIYGSITEDKYKGPSLEDIGTKVISSPKDSTVQITARSDSIEYGRHLIRTISTLKKKEEVDPDIINIVKTVLRNYHIAAKIQMGDQFKKLTESEFKEIKRNYGIDLQTLSTDSAVPDVEYKGKLYSLSAEITTDISELDKILINDLFHHFQEKKQKINQKRDDIAFDLAKYKCAYTSTQNILAEPAQKAICEDIDLLKTELLQLETDKYEVQRSIHEWKNNYAETHTAMGKQAIKSKKDNLKENLLDENLLKAISTVKKHFPQISADEIYNIPSRFEAKYNYLKDTDNNRIYTALLYLKDQNEILQPEHLEENIELADLYNKQEDKNEEITRYIKSDLSKSSEIAGKVRALSRMNKITSQIKSDINTLQNNYKLFSN
ncbi:MAG: hypothetical protein DRN71_04555 [Candidatus Nanohalarchaeota archaeon]|nr:MAG: hypothetical protein DRN71_04555 [Candidatus Nanohaloarchaeota archaeon]